MVVALSLFGASLVTQLVKNQPAMQETPVQFLDQEDLLEKGNSTHSSIFGLPLWLSRKRIRLQCRRPGFDPWVGKIPWRRERLPTPVSWPGESHGLYSPWGHKESDGTKWLSLLLSHHLFRLSSPQQNSWDYELCCQGAWVQIPADSLYCVLECGQIT